VCIVRFGDYADKSKTNFCKCYNSSNIKSSQNPLKLCNNVLHEGPVAETLIPL
jgi:hypothetical protein